MKKTDITVLREYVSKLSFDELKWLYDRFTMRMGSDLYECADKVCKHQEIDRIFANTKNAQEFFDVLDSIHRFVEREISRHVPDVMGRN